MDQIDHLTGRQKAVIGSAAAFVILVLIMNISLIGGVDLVQELDALIPLPLALLISIQLFRLWQGSRKDEIGRKIWGSFLIGLVLWFIAEGIWNVYSLLGLELPFPSLADIPWFVGYFFFFWALYLRFRSLGASLHKKEILLISLLYAPLVILTSAFSIIPIFLEGETRFFVVALSIFYPFADLIIPFRSIIVMMALRKGTLIRPWGLISASFLCLSISDLAFSYADRNNLYWPGGAPNFISVSGDWLYIVFYVLVGLGVYFAPMVFGQADLHEVEEVQVVSPVAQPVSPVAQPIPVVRKSVFISTDAHGMICYISTGAVELFGLGGPGDCLNTHLSKLLMKSEDEISDTLRKIARWGMLQKQDNVVLANDPARITPMKIHAIASRDDKGNFVGADFFFNTIETSRLQIQDHNGYVKELIHEKKEPDIQYERKEDILWYFRVQVKVIYVMIARYAGIDIAGKVVSLFNESAVKNKWQINMDPASLEVTDRLSDILEERAHIYRSLLKQVADYAIAITSYSTTVKELRILDSSVPEELKKTIAFYGLSYPYIPPDTDKTSV